MQDKETIEKAVTETTEWLDANQAAEKDEYEAKQSLRNDRFSFLSVL